MQFLPCNLPRTLQGIHLSLPLFCQRQQVFYTRFAIYIYTRYICLSIGIRYICLYIRFAMLVFGFMDSYSLGPTRPFCDAHSSCGFTRIPCCRFALYTESCGGLYAIG